MSALEKALRMQLFAAVCSVIVVLCMLPFFGTAAQAGFGLLGLGGFAAFFLRKRENKVVVDERDIAIDRLARDRSIALGGGLFLFFMVYVVSTGDGDMVSKTLLSWAMWWTFAITMAARGLFGLIAYHQDRRRNAAQV